MKASFEQQAAGPDVHARVFRISACDAAEVKAFYEQQAAWLYGQARYVTHGDKSRAQDLTQDTFEAATRHWGRLLRGLPTGSQRAWLYTALERKEIADCRRREALDKTLQQLAALHQPETGTAAGERADVIKQMREIIEALPGQQGRIARMRWGKSGPMKVREIADELGIAEGTVHATLSAVRKKLFSLLEPHYRSGEGGKGEKS